MSAVLRQTTTSQGDVVIFFCPGCQAEHAFRIKGPAPVWTWKGSVDRPTLKPSLLYQAVPGVRPRCHCLVKDGRIEFLRDCEHSLAGKTVSMSRLVPGGGWMTMPLQIAIGALIAYGALWLVCYILQLQQEAHRLP